MSQIPVVRGRLLYLVAVVALVAAFGMIAACSKSSNKPTEPEVPVAPTPNSPQNALKLLEWCWDQRNATVYRDVFTDDFLYEFAVSDSQAIGTTIDRNEELAIATNIFVEGNGAGHPAAASIAFGYDALNVQPDDRPGKNSTWHKRITTNVRLTVNTSGKDYATVQDAVFYVTRGDSAQIPAEMVARGFGPDAARWYVDHWADLTTCPPGKNCETIGKLKLDYAEGHVGAWRAGR